jgi:hypothetical protein
VPDAVDKTFQAAGKDMIPLLGFFPTNAVAVIE